MSTDIQSNIHSVIHLHRYIYSLSYKQAYMSHYQSAYSFFLLKRDTDFNQSQYCLRYCGPLDECYTSSPGPFICPRLDTGWVWIISSQTNLDLLGQGIAVQPSFGRLYGVSWGSVLGTPRACWLHWGFGGAHQNSLWDIDDCLLDSARGTFVLVFIYILYQAKLNVIYWHSWALLGSKWMDTNRISSD